MNLMTALLYFHVAVSLVGIATGLVAVCGYLQAQRWPLWTNVFLITTVLTSVSGFPLPANELKPAHILGVLSLIALGLACGIWFRYPLVGRLRTVYVISALVAQYFNMFVLIAQSLDKLPFLKAPGPPDQNPLFAPLQIVLLLAFLVVTRFALRNFPTTIFK